MRAAAADSSRAALRMKMRLLAGLIVFSVAAMAQETASLTVSHLSCEGVVEPAVVDMAAPRFSWRIESAERGARQTAYQFRIAELTSAGKPNAGQAIETPRTETDRSQWVSVAGFTAKPKQRYEWQVRVW